MRVRSVVAAVIATQLAFAVPVSADDGLNDVLYAVTVNGRHVSDGAVMAASADGTVFATAQQLEEWRLVIPAQAPLEHAGSKFYDLRGLPGAELRTDTSRMTLDMHLPGVAFRRGTADTSADAGRDDLALDRARAAFVNYSLDGSWSNGVTDVSTRLDATTAVGAGTLSTQLYGARVGNTTTFTRTLTNWTVDDPARRRVLRFGDDTTRAGMMGDAQRVFGVTVQTDDRVRPAFVASPLIGFDGVAATPSTVTIVANGRVLRSVAVPEGPFSLGARSQEDGEQDVSIVVRDAEGHTYVVSRPFYGDSRLLRRGVTQYSVSGGLLENDTSIRPSYDGVHLQGVYTRGLTDAITAEMFAVAGKWAREFGGGAFFSSARVGTFATGLAILDDGHTRRLLGELGYSYHHRGMDFAVNADRRSNPYQAIGIGSNGVNEDLTVSAGYASRFAQLRVNVSSTAIAGAPVTHSVGASLSRFSNGMSMNLSVNAGTGLTHGYEIGASLSRLLGPGRSVTVNAGTNRGVTVQQSALDRGRVSYAAGSDAQEPFFAQVGYRGHAADVQVATQNAPGGSATYATVQGGVAIVRGRLFAQPTIDQSFALVHAAYPDLPVSLNGTAMGRTDRHGDLLVPGLAAFQKNTISVDPSSLPLGVAMDTTMTVVPDRRTGRVVRFRVTAGGGVLLQIVTPSGSPLDAGTPITGRAAPPEGWYLGDGGIAYLSNVPPGPLALTARTEHGTCRADVTIPADTSGTPDLGKVVCR